MNNIESAKGEIVMYLREDELSESSVVKESLTTAKDGKRYKITSSNVA